MSLSYDETILCDFCKKWICDRKGYAVIIAITVLNLLVLVYNCCKGFKRRDTSDKSPTNASEDRTLRNMQLYISQQHAQARDLSSVVIPSGAFEISIPQGVSPTVFQLPEQVLPEHVNCTVIFPHRKLFLGRIEWGGFEGFLKECSNPLEMALHRRLKQHKNIVQFYFVNIADKPKIIIQEGLELAKQLPISFYCMEYCPRGNLSSFLVSDGHVIEKRLLFVLISDVVRGIQYLHTLKVAHRDIKTENILIQGLRDDPVTLVAKVADFDHAIQTDNAFEMGTAGRGKGQFGSPLYTAPEFILEKIKQPVAADFFRHDVFSLGLVIWECLTWIKCRYREKLAAAHNNTTLTASLLPRSSVNEVDTTTDTTTDIGGFRPVVKCSSTVHLPLVKQICDTLKLKYDRQGKELRVNNLFLKQGRLIDTKLMFEFYSKKPNARPVLFRDKGEGYTWDFNATMEGCWRSDPADRLSVNDVLETLDRICESAAASYI